jgi:hypothetical protein
MVGPSTLHLPHLGLLVDVRDVETPVIGLAVLPRPAEVTTIPFPLNAPKIIREKMVLGILPSDKPSKMYAVHGTGEPCEGCETPILPA